MIDPVNLNPDSPIAAILDHPSESRSIELKSSQPWGDINRLQELQNIVKSILGLSNVKDGGKIILGIKQRPDRTFESTGMLSSHLHTFDQDNIYQVVRAYGNPAPIFEIKNFKYKANYFIVFSVQEFLYTPVICIKAGSRVNNEPLIKGSLYIRTHKPETKKVDNETEMREIINLAIDKEFGLWTPRIKKINKTPRIKKKTKENGKKKFETELKDIIL